MSAPGETSTTTEGAARAAAPPPSTRASRAETFLRGPRAALVAVSLLAGIALVGWVTGSAQALDTWLIWRYLRYAGLTLFWALSCASSGLALLRRIKGLRLPARERWVFSFGVGVILFGSAIVLLGAVGGLGSVTFFVLPTVMLAAGARPLWREVRLVARTLGGGLKLAPSDLALAAFALLGLALLYFKVVAPAHAGYDARWYHLPIAEHYAATGRVSALREGSILGAYPQLMTFLYAWAFLYPQSILFDRVELAAHVEFAVLVATLATIPFVARRAAGSRAGGRAFPLALCFPALFMYGPQCEADMLAALFGALTALALLRFWHRPTRELGGLVGVCMGGLLATKYSTACVLAPAALIFAARLALNRAWKEAGLVAATTGGSFALSSACHWLKNWAFYGDPLFPLLVGRLPAHPLTAQGREILKWYWPHEVWRPPANLTGLRQAAVAAFNFAFDPHEYVSVGHGWPLFGFLFTCGLLVLPWCRARAEAWLLAAGTTVGVFTWYWVHHQDRYLQALLGWMVPVAFVALRAAWNAGLVPRLLTGALLGLQVLWGSDVFFHHAPVTAALSLITSGREGPAARHEQLDVFRPMAEVGRALPPHATVLVHEMHDHLGLQAASVSDFAGWQTGISYVETSSARALHELLTTKMRVTHILSHPGSSTGMASLGSDLAFFRYLSLYAGAPTAIGPFALASVAATPPAPDTAPDEAYVILCDGTYATGLYPLSSLNVRTVDPPPAAEYPRPRLELDGMSPPPTPVAVVALDSRCPSRPAFLAQPGPGPGTYTLVARRGSTEIWIRRP